MREGYRPLERTLRLLMLLTHASRALTRAEVVAALRDVYTSDVQATNFSNLTHDLAPLRQRGLVQSGLRDAHGTRYGIRRNPLLEKNSSWHLTAEEHDALVEVRRVMRPTQPVPPPASVPAGEKSHDRSTPIEAALRILRILEEHIDGLSLADLATYLGVTTLRTSTWVRQLDMALYAAGYGARIDIDAPDGEAGTCNDSGTPLSPTTLVCLVRRFDPEAPVVGVGTSLVGLFPYTLEEVHERLSLIHSYCLARAGLDARLDIVLTGIDDKLQNWAATLATAQSVRS